MASVDVVRSRHGPLRVHARALSAAFTLLTRLPARCFAAHDASDLPSSVTYFPAVGLAVAVIGGAAYATAALLWPVVIAVLLSVMVTVFVTGAIHEDGLADALDGFYGGWSRDQVLAIMKDSRVGSYGLVGFVLVLATKVATLATIAHQSTTAVAVVRALVAAHVLARWSSLPLMWKYPYVRPANTGERASAGGPFVDATPARRVLAGSVLTLAIVVIALGARVAAAGAAAALLTVVAGQYCSRRIGGITGDALGATNQLVELAVYLVLAASLPA